MSQKLEGYPKAEAVGTYGDVTLWDTEGLSRANERGCIVMTTNGSDYHAYLTPEQAIALSVDLGRLAGVVACGRCSGTRLIFKGKGTAKCPDC